MPTLTQINDFKLKARAKGYSEQQISDAVAKKITADAGATGSGVTTKPTATTTAPQKGFFAKVGETLIRPLADYTKFIGEAGYQGARALTSDITKVGGMNKDLDKLIKQNQDVLKQAKATKNTEEKQRLLQQSRDISNQIDQIGQKAGEVGKLKPTALLDEKKIATRGEIVKTGVKATAGAMSYAVPTGATLKTALGAGAIAGGLLGVSEGEEITLENVLKGAAGGAVAGGVGYGIGKIIQKATGGYKNLAKTTEPIKKNTIKDWVSGKAEKSLTKATPTQWQKAVEDHGLDLNKTASKYFAKGSSYDDVLGPLSDRGAGGILGNTIKKSEKEIATALKASNANTKVPVDEFVSALQKEKKLLAKIPGNENNIKAMENFIASLSKKYKNGILPKDMLAIKRAADSKFGQAVADEATGSAIAQSQKMLANGLRAKLKQLFPEVKNALDTEMEIYTIQPVLNRARGIYNTAGSELRIGSMKGAASELLNPINWIDSILSNPKIASRFINRVGQEATPEVAQQLTQATAENAGEGLFSRFIDAVTKQAVSPVGGATAIQMGAGEGVDTQKQLEPTDQVTDISQLPSEAGLPETQKSTNVFGGMTKEEFLQGAFMSGMTMAQLKELGQVYDMMVPEDKQKDQKVSATAQNQINLATAGLKGLQDAQAIFDEDPAVVYKGLVTAGLSSRKFEAALGRAIEGVLRARSGAAVPDSEVKKYRDLYGPKVGDTKAVALYKLQALKQDLEGIISGNTGADFAPDTQVVQ